MTDMQETVEPMIQLHDLKMLEIDKIKEDPTNPNILTQEQMNALEQSFKRFGYLVPIIVDGSWMIADGWHRVMIYKKFGLDTIPGYVVDFKNDEERRLLRQVMNKLHGTHDPEKDIQEIRLLYDSGKLADLSILLAKDQDIFMKLLSKSYDDIPFQGSSLSETHIYQVVIDCQSEDEQEKVFAKLQEQGFKCSVLII